MNDAEINDLAARIEAATPSQQAIVRCVQHGGGPDESHMEANRAGYLRLSVLFLRAAVAPLQENSATVDVDSSEIMDENSDIYFAWLERREKFESVEYSPSFAEKLLPLGCSLLGMAVLALLVVGVFTVIQWVASYAFSGA